MARQQRQQAPQTSSAMGEHSAEERKGMRAHDDNGNVRPADGRWDLHKPEDESKHVRTSKGEK